MLNPIIVVIDDGHGGADGGAPAGGYKEKDINYILAGKVIYFLNKEQNIKAFVTRPNDTAVSLESRVKIANNLKANLFVSIHCNGSANLKAEGVETYCYKFGGKGEKAARLIHSELVGVGLKPDRGVKEGNFYVLRKTNMPAVLCEVGFISNNQDRSELTDPVWQNNIAYAIAQGILKYRTLI